jgi:hypothetical protein
MRVLDWLPAASDSYGVRSFLQQLVTRELSERSGSENELKTIYLFLTRKCNLGCQHCYIEGGRPEGEGS